MDYLSRIDRSLGLEPEEKEEEKKYIEADSYLDRIDRSLAPQAQPEEESGFGSDLLHALFQGADQTTAMLGATAMLSGGPDASENIASHYKNRKNPAYVNAYDQLLAKNTAEREEHWNQDNYWKWLGSLGEWAYNATNDDKSLTYKIVEMLPNSVPTFGGGAAGGLLAAGAATVAGIAAAPAAAIIGTGFIVGMGIGTVLTIIGEKSLDNVEEFGGSLEDAGSIRQVFDNPEFQKKAAKEGWIKGIEIAVVDALSFKLAGRLFTKHGKKLEKSISDELTAIGVNPMEQAAVRKAYSDPKLRGKLQNHIDDYLKSTYEATDETIASVRRAADEFAKSQTFTNKVRRGVGAIGIESLGEGVGEFVGEYHATGEPKLSDAMFEALAGLGQSAGTVVAAKSLGGANRGAKKALQKISRAQVASTAEGKNSGLDPADINAAQAEFNVVDDQTINALNERVRSEGSATPTIAAYEQVLGDNEIRGNLDQIIEGLIEEVGYEQYQETLKGFAREVYGESVSLYVPIDPADEALVQSSESIPPETSTVAQAANISGEYITVYTDDGKPIRTKVVKESASGTKIVLDEDGSEVFLDNGSLQSDNPLSPAYKPQKKYGVAALGPITDDPNSEMGASVSELSDEDLSVAANKAEKNLAAFKGDKTQAGAYYTILSDLNALKAEQARRSTPATISNLTGYVVGSLDRNGVTARPDSNIVRITVPVDDIVSRGNQAKGQLVVRVDNLQRAELTPTPKAAKGASPLRDALATRAGQITQEEQLGQYEGDFDAGHREVEVEDSKKTDPKKLSRVALRENEGKASRLLTASTLREGANTKTEDGKRVTAISLARVITRNKVPTQKGRGKVVGTIDTRKRDINDYRNALEKPDQLEAVNVVLKKLGAKLVRKNKNKELVLTDNAGNEYGFGTVRVQDYTVDEYLDFVEEQKTEVAADAQRASERQSERTRLSAVVDREKKRKAPEGRVATTLQRIEENFVNRDGGVTKIDAAGLDQYLEQVQSLGDWKKGELTSLKRGVQRFHDEANITKASRDTSRPAPRHHVITGTKPSSSAPGMGKVSRLKGRTLRKFHASASSILRHLAGRGGVTDALLAKITGVYVKQGKVGAVGKEGGVTPANIFQLAPSVDNDIIARVYSLASMLIYGQDSVTYSRPDSSLNLDSDSTSLGGHLKSTKVLTDSQFGKLNQEVQRVVGPDSTLIRISDFEYIIHNDSLGKSQLARRLGRLQAKFGKTYGIQTEFFVSKTETLTHNWAGDSLGEGIRDRIRAEGFSDLLTFVDNRRDALFELARQYGANIAETKQQGINFEQPPATGPPKRKTRASLATTEADVHPLDVLYHVAFTEDVAAIKSEGIQPFGGKKLRSNWVTQEKKKRLGTGGNIYAFSNLPDALKWGFHMEWEFNQTSRTGTISIVSFNDDGKWEVDEGGSPLDRLGYDEDWITKFGPVKPENIIASETFVVKKDPSEYNLSPKETGPPKGKVRASFAHHGTGADLKGRKYDLKYIGTGEGAQAYGWGIYFAELLKIAQWYKRSNEKRLTYVDGVEADSQNPHHAFSEHYRFEFRNINLLSLPQSKLNDQEYITDAKHEAAIDKTIEHYTNLVFAGWRNKDEQARKQSFRREVLKLAEEARANPSVIGEVTTEFKSNLYTVDIDEEFIDRMLDWDAKISDDRAQPVNLMEAFEAFANSSGIEFNDESLEEWFDEHGMDFDRIDNVTGQELYRMAVKAGEGLPVLEEEYEGQLGDQQRASLWLLSRGISGLKYLDNVSRRGSTERFKIYVELDGADVAAVPRFNSAGKKIVKKKASRFRRDGEMPKHLLRMKLIDDKVFRSFWGPKKGRRVSPNRDIRENFADHLTSFLLEYSVENEGETRTTQEMLEAYQNFGATELAFNNELMEELEEGDAAPTIRGYAKKHQEMIAWGSAVIESGRLKFKYTTIPHTRNFVIWDQEALDTLNTDPPDVKASILLKKPADGGFFLGRARSELNKRWGKKNIDSLEAQGILKIVSNVTELPADIQDLYETHEGVHDETTGISYLIAENIREGRASGVLMHEVGTHFGLRRMIGNKAFSGILSDLLNRRTSDELAPYFAEVKRAYESMLKTGEMVEFSEDFLEEVLAKIAQDPKASNMGIIEELVRRMMVFLSKHFEGINITPADLQALTRGALRKSMKGRFRAESLEGSRVMAAVGDSDPKFVELVMNMVRRPDAAYRDFPANPTRKVSNRHKDAEFSSPLAEDHVNKKAKNKLWEATQALEEIFNGLNDGRTMDIDFSLDERAFSKSERVVRIRERKSGTMLVYRFGFEPIDKIKGLMLGPVVDIYNMGVTTKNEEYTLLQMKADFQKGIKLLKQGKLKKQHALSLWADFRMGPKPPANYFIRHLKEGQTWDQFILAEELTDKQTVGRIVMTEDIAIQNGYLPDGPVTPIQSPHGRYRYSLPSQSTNDLDAADKAVIQKATGKAEPGHVSQAYENFRRDPKLWFGQGVADRYLSIKNTLGNDGERAWKMMQLSDSADGLLHAVLQYGRPKEMTLNGEFDGYALDENSRGLMTILEGLEGETDRFLTWMAGHRSEHLSKPTTEHPEGREKFFTKEDRKKMMRLGKGKTISGKSRTLLFAQTMRELSKFQSSIIDLAVKSGFIGKEDRMALLTDFYLPFYREFEKEGKTHIKGPAMNNDAVNLRTVIHGLQGSELKTHDLLHNLMMNWHSLLNASMKNRAGVAAVKAAVKAGVARLLDKKEGAQVSYGKTRSKTDKYDNMVYVMRDGEKEWYEINDHFVLQSLLQLNWQGPTGMFSSAMSSFKRMLTITVTASPAFKVRNLIRDTLHSVAVSDLSYNIFGNVKEGITRASIHDPIYQRLIASGGAFHFGFLHDDPSSIRRILKHANKGLPRNEKELKNQVLDTTGKAMNFLRKGWDKYGEVGNRLENANRVALYLQKVDEIGHLEASFEARDLLNFAAGGSFPVVQYLTNGIAFLNARIVGTHKLIRSGTEAEKRSKFIKVVGTITLASILYELGMDDDEDYRNLPNFIKETYWPVRIPGDKEKWFLLPKPFEVGAIASIGQRMTQMFIDESVSPAFFANRVFNILRDQLAFDWRFQAFKPILEVGLNYDSFRDQNIESAGWEASGKLKHKRFRQNSSELSKAASAFLADYQPGDTALSPVQIDHLIRGYFGWIGMTIAGWGDIVLGDDAPEPTARFGDSKPGVMNLWGVAPVSSFYKEGPLKGNAQVNVFWEQYKDMQTLWLEYKDFANTNGAEGEFEEWLAENGKTIMWRKKYETMRKYLGKIRKHTNAVYDDLEMSPDEKRKRIDEYIELKNKSAEGLVKMRQEYEQSEESGYIIRDAKADASVETDYDVAAVQKALYKSQYGPKEKTIEDKLYESVNAAEFRGMRRFIGSHFIRTRHAPEGGSSAYGPLQITIGLMRLAKDDLKLTKAESSYVKRFIRQGEMFLKFGNEPDREGYESKYDYGGEGDLSGSADRKLYEQVGKKLLALVWGQSHEDPQAFLNSWRFGGKKEVEKQDREYFDAFHNEFKD